MEAKTLDFVSSENLFSNIICLNPCIWQTYWMAAQPSAKLLLWSPLGSPILGHMLSQSGMRRGIKGCLKSEGTDKYGLGSCCFKVCTEASGPPKLHSFPSTKHSGSIIVVL